MKPTAQDTHRAQDSMGLAGPHCQTDHHEARRADETVWPTIETRGMRMENRPNQPSPPSCCEAVAPDIIGQAFILAETVARFAARVRQFYYDVMLSGLFCPACQGRVEMVGEGRPSW